MVEAGPFALVSPSLTLQYDPLATARIVNLRIVLEQPILDWIIHD